MEQATDAEKAMAVHEFLDLKRKNKVNALYMHHLALDIFSFSFNRIFFKRVP